MDQKFIRAASILGEDALIRLKNSRVALFGLGGVGSFALEALVRSGIGNIDIFDNDTVNITNINRQIIATTKTLGQNKTTAAAARAKDINPNVNIGEFPIFYLPENADEIDLSKYDYIIDAIDTVTSKIELVVRAEKCGVPIISIMGTGNKTNPTKLKISDIFKTTNCPLCRVMRRELKKRQIKRLCVVWSDEIPLVPNSLAETKENGRLAPGSTAFVPSAAGIFAASQVVNDLIKQ